jgi:esterase/lipase superfamily enzyme
LRDYLTDVETTAFTAQHFRMLLAYLALNTEARRIHIVCYSAGARIVSQALHELRLMGYGFPANRLKEKLKIGQVVFAAPDIDLMLFVARYRDRFGDIADTITIYTNANDTALHWALRFIGWPRLGAPGELGLTPEELRTFSIMENTWVIDVAAAEDTDAGNGHGYFIKSPWVSTDLLLTLRYGFDPGNRGLVLRPDGLNYEFPGTYPEKIAKVAQKKSLNQ